MRLLASRLCIDRGGRRIVSDVSFEMTSGVLLITGENGAGKSSLLRVLAGLLPPADGSFSIEGADDVDVPLLYLGHRDGLKPQLTVRENLRFAADFLRQGDAVVDPLAALSAYGMEGTIDVPVGFLSTGQRRRVALARLLVSPRPLWLLDEPTNGLDFQSIARFEECVKAHVSRGGIVLAATHAPLRVPARELRLSAGND